VTAGATAVGDEDASVARYEELRHGVLTGAPGGRHVGVLVLVREGLAAWLAQGSACAATVGPAAVPLGRPAALQVLSEVHASVVRVLANMALASRRELRP
jgi:hypothetical protein